MNVQKNSRSFTAIIHSNAQQRSVFRDQGLHFVQLSVYTDKQSCLIFLRFISSFVT